MVTTSVTQRISIQNILFTTDFSPTAETAIPYVLALARGYGTKIFMVHAVRPEPILAIPMEPTPVEMDFNWQDAQAKMADFVRRDPLQGFAYEPILGQGELWDVVSGAIEQNHIDLVVLGTHGRSGLRKVIMGSAAERIFRLAPCPVLTVGPQADSTRVNFESWKRILFATDFSAGSLHALPYALSLAEENQATLTLLHLIPLVPLQEEKASMEAVRRRLQDLVPRDADAWCKVESEVRIGFPSEEILRIANEKRADLIVMGVHAASSPLASTHLPWAIGHEVVSQASCPVLTVRG